MQSLIKANLLQNITSLLTAKALMKYSRQNCRKLQTAHNNATTGRATRANERAQTAQQKAPKETSIFDTPAMKQVERTAASVITRSLLGALGLGGRTKRLW